MFWEEIKVLMNSSFLSEIYFQSLPVKTTAAFIQGQFFSHSEALHLWVPYLGPHKLLGFPFCLVGTWILPCFLSIRSCFFCSFWVIIFPDLGGFLTYMCWSVLSWRSEGNCLWSFLSVQPSLLCVYLGLLSLLDLWPPPIEDPGLCLSFPSL